MRWLGVACIVAMPIAAGCIGDLPSPGQVAGSTAQPAHTTAVGNTNSVTNPGPTGDSPYDGALTLHRLNRAEYNNTVRDLFATLQTPADGFPDDVSVGGFDNGSTLSVTPTTMDLYALAAQSLVDEALSPNSPVLTTLIPCDPNAMGRTPCLEDVVQNFGWRAWRRPLVPSEVQTLVTLGAQAGSDTFVAEVNLVLQAMLVSPAFLYRIESDPTQSGQPSMVISDYEMASRLSYFLWSSTPDITLLQAAAQHSLHTDTQLTAQVERLLADPRASALTDNFAGQWLGIRSLANFTPAAGTFPQFTDAVHSAMTAETQGFFNDFLTNDQPLNQLLTANYSYLNDTLATYYGITPPGSANAAVRTTLPAGTRSGLLMQGTFLVGNSFANRTSPVLRGVFILTSLLCSATPPPPANIPQLGDAPTGTTERQLLEAHVSNATCAACHNLIDPLGFAFEGFDAVGEARTTDNGEPVDTTGTFGALPFSNGAGLAALLANDPRVGPCIAGQMFTYSLGRAPSSNESLTLQTVSQSLQTQGKGLRSLVHQMVLSNAFRTYRGTP